MGDNYYLHRLSVFVTDFQVYLPIFMHHNFLMKFFRQIKVWISNEWIRKTNPDRFKFGIQSGQTNHLKKFIGNELISIATSRLDSILFHGTIENGNLPVDQSINENLKFWNSHPGNMLLSGAVKIVLTRLNQKISFLNIIIEEFKRETSPIKYELERDGNH
jgi:hypothetical protein